MMHGQSRVRKQEIPPEELRKQEEQAAKVLEQTSYFFKVRRNEVPQPEDPLAYSELLAKLCPEISTIYNYRRELIQARLATGEKEDLAALLNREFELNTGLIKRHPKSYTLWSYREWLVLESERIDAQHGTAINAIQREFGLCSKMLTLDERNFHVWNYRNWLTATSGHGDVEAFTLQKIKQNFSNFSAYHFRSKDFLSRYNTVAALQQALKDGSQCPLSPVPITKVRDDLKIVQEAIYIQPKEHGVYLYHKWLLGVIQPFGVVRIEQTSPTDFQLVLNRKARNVQHSVVVEGIESFTVTAQQEYSDRWTLTFAEAPPQVIEIRISNGLLSGSQAQEDEINNSRYYVPITYKLVDGKTAYSQVDKDTLDGLQCVKQLLEENIEFIQSLIDEEGLIRFALLQKAALLTYLYELNLFLSENPEERQQAATRIRETYQSIEPKDPSILHKIVQWQ